MSNYQKLKAIIVKRNGTVNKFKITALQNKIELYVLRFK